MGFYASLDSKWPGPDVFLTSRKLRASLHVVIVIGPVNEKVESVLNQSYLQVADDYIPIFTVVSIRARK